MLIILKFFNFVKDTNNILPHEFWTPEYRGNVSFETIGDFRLNATTSEGYYYSDTYSSLGEYSIMQKVQSNQYIVLFDNNVNVNKNYTINVDIYNNVNVILYFIGRNTNAGTNTIIKQITIPQNTITSHTLTINSNEFTGGETQLQFRITPLNNNGTIYSTNFILYEQ